MQSLKDYLQIYGKCHQVSINRLMHYFAVPMIILSLLLALNWVRIDIVGVTEISCNWLLVAGVLLFYYRLHLRLALLVTVIAVPLTAIMACFSGSTPTLLSTTIALFLFFGGWILQFIGHLFERKKPAFMSSLTQLLIGPLFFLVEALGRFDYKSTFKVDWCLSIDE